MWQDKRIIVLARCLWKMHHYSTLETWLYVTMAWVEMSDRRRDKVGREG